MRLLPLAALAASVVTGTPARSTAQASSLPPSSMQAAGQAPVHAVLRAFRGDTVRVGSGAPTLVAVFATWCRSCRDEVAVFNRLQSELAPRGVRVVAVSADDVGDERVAAWLARVGAQYPATRDSSRALLRTLGAVGVPEAYLLDATGRMRWSRRGPIESGLPALRAAVAALPPVRR